jgi:GR25 family glycosyltransferase involved in LPS biosynthesis
MLKFSSNNVNIIEKNGDYIITPIKINDNYLEIYSSKNIHLQFKLTSNNIDNFNIIHKDKIINTKNTSKEYIISINLNEKNNIKIVPLMNINSWFCISKINYNEKNEDVNIIYDNIFVINLLKDFERKQNIIKEFKKNNITNFEFIEGFDGNDENIYKEYLKYKKNSNIVSKGHYGCLLSHIKCIELAKRRNYKGIIITEDDVYLDDNFKNIIDNIKLPESDIIYFGGIIKEVKIFLDDYYYHNDIMGAYSYYIPSRMFDIIIDKLKTFMDCVDISYIKNFQINNNCIILNDLVKTNIIDSNTSAKSKNFIDNFNKTAIVHNIIENNKDIQLYKYKNAYILDYYECSNFYNLFIKDKYENYKYIQDVNEIPLIELDNIIIINNLYNIQNVDKLINYNNIIIIIINFYWLSNKIEYQKDNSFKHNIYNYKRKNINIHNEIKKLFYNINEVIFVSQFSHNIYQKYFNMNNMKILDLKSSTNNFDKNIIDDKINILIVDIYGKENEQINIIMNKFTIFADKKINYIYLSSYDKSTEIDSMNIIHGIIYLNTFSLAYCFNINDLLTMNKPLLYNNFGSLKEQITNTEYNVIICNDEKELDNIDLLNRQMIKFLCLIIS